MGFFNTESHETRRFEYLSDGRILFLPRGPGGPVHLVPDYETRDRIARRYAVLDWGTKIALTAALLAGPRFGVWYAVPVLMAAIFVLPRWLATVTVESLPQTHEAEAIRATRLRDDERSRTPGLVAMLLFGAGLVGMGAYQFSRRQELDFDVLSAVAAGLWLVLMSLKQWSDQRTDAITGNSRIEPANTPIHPR